MRDRSRIFVVPPVEVACCTASCSETLFGSDRSENRTIWNLELKIHEQILVGFSPIPLKVSMCH